MSPHVLEIVGGKKNRKILQPRFDLLTRQLSVFNVKLEHFTVLSFRSFIDRKNGSKCTNYREHKNVKL